MVGTTLFGEHGNVYIYIYIGKRERERDRERRESESEGGREGGRCVCVCVCACVCVCLSRQSEEPVPCSCTGTFASKVMPSTVTHFLSFQSGESLRECVKWKSLPPFRLRHIGLSQVLGGNLQLTTE